MRLYAAVLALALAAPSLAWSQAPETPERVLRLNYVEGVVGLQAADARAPTTLPDRPLIPGDRLITQDGGRAELALDTSAIRLDERSELRIEALAAASVRLGLDHGVASLRLRELLEGETFEIATENASIALRQPGEYRVEAQSPDLTVLTVRGGIADVATAAGPVRIASGQRVRFEGHEAHASLEPPSSTDDFDDWVLDREVRVAEAAPSFYGFDARDSYAELDRNGNWYDDPGYGRVWMPCYAYGSWDQFSHGHWQRSGYGWSWFSSAPWGFFTFHSGRWAFLHDRNRWCWVPGQPAHTPRVASETHPFGHSRHAVDSRHTDDGRLAMSQTRAEPRAQPRREVHVFSSVAAKFVAAAVRPRRRRVTRRPCDLPAAPALGPVPGHPPRRGPACSARRNTSNPDGSRGAMLKRSAERSPAAVGTTFQS